MFAGLKRLLGIGGAPAEVPSVSNDEEHDRVYERGAQLIFPRMQVLGRNETRSGKDRAKLQEGIACMQAVATYNPGNWGAHWIAGKAYQSLGDNARANESFKTAFDIERSNADVGREYAVSCLELGRADQAIAALAAAIKGSPGNSSLHAHLALAHIIVGNDDDARAAVTKAIEVGADDTVAESALQMIEDIQNGKRPRPRNMEELDLI